MTAIRLDMTVLLDRYVTGPDGSVDDRAQRVTDLRYRVRA
jgi:hypothetical protein